VILVDDEHWTVRADGDIERAQHLVLKILSASAMQNFDGVQERWELWHMKRPEIRARVISNDGAIHELDPKTLVDAPGGGNANQTCSDVRVIQGPLPAIEAGAVVEEQITEVTTPVLGSMAFRGYIAGGIPVRFKESQEAKEGRVHLMLVFGSFEPVQSVDPYSHFDALVFPPLCPGMSIFNHAIVYTSGAKTGIERRSFREQRCRPLDRCDCRIHASGRETWHGPGTSCPDCASRDNRVGQDTRSGTRNQPKLGPRTALSASAGNGAGFCRGDSWPPAKYETFARLVRTRGSARFVQLDVGCVDRLAAADAIRLALQQLTNDGLEKGLLASDGNRLLFEGSDTQVYQVSVNGSAPTPFPLSKGYFIGPFSPDRTELLLGAEQRRVRRSGSRPPLVGSPNA
jgi:hypothetical protein